MAIPTNKAFCFRNFREAWSVEFTRFEAAPGTYRGYRKSKFTTGNFATSNEAVAHAVENGFSPENITVESV